MTKYNGKFAPPADKSSPISSSNASDSKKITRALKNHVYKKMVDDRVEQHNKSEKRFEENVS